MLDPLANRVEVFIKENIVFPHKIREINPQDLITANRFDLGFKLFYLRNRERNPRFSELVYSEHIKAFNNGQFKEYGSRWKNTKEAFLNEFVKIDEQISCDGFDSSISLVPLSINGSIVNGAHRLSSCIRHCKRVATIQTDLEEHEYSYDFFKDRLVRSDYLDLSAIEVVRHNKNLRLAIVWGNAFNSFEKFRSFFGDIFYVKDLNLTNYGVISLVSIVYSHEDWLGNPASVDSGAYQKANSCFGSCRCAKVVVYEHNKKTRHLKKQIRGLFCYGKHSLHTTDTHSDTLRISEMLFNSNTIHYLNKTTNKFYRKCMLESNLIHHLSKKNSISLENIIIAGSYPLQMYGHRMSKDLDYLAGLSNNLPSHPLVSSHKKELPFYSKDLQETLYNPQYYFTVNGIKYISIDQMILFKKNRGEKKDINDLKMIQESPYQSIADHVYYDVYRPLLYRKTRLINYLKETLVFLMRRANIYSFYTKKFKKQA